MHLPSKQAYESSILFSRIKIMTVRDEKFIALLSRIAEDLTDHVKTRICAAVVLKNQIISFGTNSRKTDPFQARFGKNTHNIYQHAEIAAIKRAKNRISEKDMRNTTLYVVRRKFTDTNRNFCYGIAKPCDGCAKAIKEYGIKTVIWTENEGEEL